MKRAPKMRRAHRSKCSLKPFPQQQRLAAAHPCYIIVWTLRPAAISLGSTQQQRRRPQQRLIIPAITIQQQPTSAPLRTQCPYRRRSPQRQRRRPKRRPHATQTKWRATLSVNRSNGWFSHRARDVCTSVGSRATVRAWIGACFRCTICIWSATMARRFSCWQVIFINYFLSN